VSEIDFTDPVQEAAWQAGRLAGIREVADHLWWDKYHRPNSRRTMSSVLRDIYRRFGVVSSYD